MSSMPSRENAGYEVGNGRVRLNSSIHTLMSKFPQDATPGSGLLKDGNIICCRPWGLLMCTQ